MKARPILPLILAACLLLAGAAPPAPVIPTRGFYLNDYASVLVESHRQAILSLSADLDEQTGIQVVVLTVKDLGSLSPDEYAAAIVGDWGIGGPSGERGILLLIASDSGVSHVLVGDNLPGLAEYADKQVAFGENLSAAIMALYRPLLADAYAQAGASPPDDLRPLLDATSSEATDGLHGWVIVLLGAVLLVVLRSYRVSRKYRQKYLKPNVRKHRTFTRTYSEDNDID